MTKLLLIHTGGTIACAPTQHGLAPKPELLEEKARHIIATDSKYAHVNVQMIAFDPIIDSSDMKYSHWNMMMNYITQYYHDYDGFIITHGTDSMAYSTVAVAYGLGHIDKPVIFTGSMLPIAQENSDGVANLKHAIMAASDEKNKGVWLQFADCLYNGKAITKYRTQSHDAFLALNHHIDIEHQHACKNAYYEYQEHHIPIITLTPTMSSDLLAAILDIADGAVLRCYGSGTIGNDKAIYDILCRAHDQHKPIIAITQALQGSIKMGRYVAGHFLTQAHIIDGGALHEEGAIAFLGQLLAHGDVGLKAN